MKKALVTRIHVCIKEKENRKTKLSKYQICITHLQNMTGMLVDLQMVSICIPLYVWYCYEYMNVDWITGVPMLLASIVFSMTISMVCERMGEKHCL